MNNCSMCPFYCFETKDLISHLIKRHRNAPNFAVHCSSPGCGATFRNTVSFRSHCFRKHFMEGHVENEMGDDFAEDEMGAIVPDNLENRNDIERKISEAQYILKLKSQHNLPQSAVNDILSSTKILISEHCELVKRKLFNILPDNSLNGIDLDSMFKDECFDNLDTEFLQDRFFSEHLGYIKPVSVKLGEMNLLKKVKGKYRYVTRDVLGYYVPFIEQLQELLAMPEVQESLISDRSSEFEYSDIFDGLYYQKPYFQNRNALLISIYYDDFEIVNPIGSHKKKHKLSIFYWNLLNILPEFRYKVQATQLLAVAQTKHVRKFGWSNLVSNFIDGMNQLHAGYTFDISNSFKKYYGALFFAIGDTPAAQFMGGFKEGVSFATKPCRTCNISHNELNDSRTSDQFTFRNETEHHDRCDILTNLRGEAKTYWSKMYGITSTSPLCRLPVFEVTKCILHDPMHVLLEGIVKTQIQLLLYGFIEKKKYFSLKYVNTVIRNFNYTDEERADKPQEIEKKALDTKNTFPMTAIETKNLMVLLPYMIGEKIPENDKSWENFIRLIQITLLIISPVSSMEGIDTLSQLIATYLHNFRELYPDKDLTPKMHFLSHMPMQMKLFGPGRNHWCIRQEAKHNLFKNKKWKNFKSIAFSIAHHHQRWMCLQQTGVFREKSLTYLYKGDHVKDGIAIDYNDINPRTSQYIQENGFEIPQKVLSTQYLNIKDVVYRPGAILLLELSDDGPKFGVIENIFIIDNNKFFETNQLDVEEFLPHFNSFSCTKTGRLRTMAYSRLKYKWVQKGHYVNGMLHVMTNNVDFCWI